MAVRTANARWEGALKEGNGTMALGSGGFQGRYSFSSRFEEGTGTNPEELIGAARPSPTSWLRRVASRGGSRPPRAFTSSPWTKASRSPGSSSPPRGEVGGVGAEEFQRHAEEAKRGCPVSKALEAVEITLDARLVGAGAPAAGG
jgi:lipoyl-dependent peroxiredoxin